MTKSKQVNPWDYPEIHVITYQDRHGFMQDEINLVTPNNRFLLVTIPAGNHAVLTAYLNEFQSLKVAWFYFNGKELLSLDK